MKRFSILLIVFLATLSACTRASTKGPLTTPLPFNPPSSPSPTLSATETPLAPTSLPETPTLPTDTPLPTLAPTETNPADPFVTFLFTGQIAPLPCAASGTLFSEIFEYLQPATFTVGTFLPIQPACLDENAIILKTAGVDISVIASQECAEGDCGSEPFSAAMSGFQKEGITPLSPGGNGESDVVVVDVEGVRYGFVTVDEEGNVPEEVAKARGMADVVIVLPLQETGTDPLPNPAQLTLARSAAEAGADLIVGSAPIIQAFGEVEGVPVFYGLGNFYGEEGAEGMMVRVYFRGTEFLGFELFPTYVDSEGVHLTDEEETAAILEGLQKVNEELP